MSEQERYEVLARAVRAQDGSWDTHRAVTTIRDAGATAADGLAAEKQARKVLRRLGDDGLLANVPSPGNTAVYRREDEGANDRAHVDAAPLSGAGCSHGRGGRTQ